MGNCDAYVNIAGGIRISEPAIDLGIALAIISSFKNKVIDEKDDCYGRDRLKRRSTCRKHDSRARAGSKEAGLYDLYHSGRVHGHREEYQGYYHSGRKECRRCHAAYLRTGIGKILQMCYNVTM